MGTLGTYLRTTRESRNIDLREAAQQTRISLNFLKAIEEEDFSRLPGEVFVKGFLKSYAKFLLLPEDEVMKRYGEIGAPQTAASASAQAAPKPPKAPKPEPRKAVLEEKHTAPREEEHPGRIGLEPFLWGGAVIIGLAAFILIALPGSHKKTGGHKPTVATKGTETAGIVAAPTATVIPEKLYLDIYALEDMWVLVRTDASPQKKATLKKGESVTWSADERFLLSYASIGSAKLVLNGKELTVTGPKSAVVRDLIVTASGIALQKVEAEQKPRRPKPVSQPTATDTFQPKPQQPEQQPAVPPAAPPAPAPVPAPAPSPKPQTPPATPSYMPPGE